MVVRVCGRGDVGNGGNGKRRKRWDWEIGCYGLEMFGFSDQGFGNGGNGRNWRKGQDGWVKVRVIMAFGFFRLFSWISLASWFLFSRSVQIEYYFFFSFNVGYS